MGYGIKKLWTAPDVDPINNKAKWVPVLVCISCHLSVPLMRSEPALFAWESLLILLARVFRRVSVVVRFSAPHSRDSQNRSQIDPKRHCQWEYCCTRCDPSR